MKVKVFVAFLICVSVLAISVNASCSNKNESDNNIESTIGLFRTSVKNDDLTGFKRLVGRDGLIIIRNFISGGAGVRGKNVRNHYDYTSIPKSLTFQIKGETPVSLKELFHETLNDKDIPRYQLENVKIINVRELEPSTGTIVDYCIELLGNLALKDDDSPQVIVLEDGLIIKEASLVNGQPIGVWAFFEKDEAKYFLKGIFDFR